MTDRARERGEPFEIERDLRGHTTIPYGRYLCIPLLEGERLDEYEEWGANITWVRISLTREPAHQERRKERRKGERRVARKRVDIRGAASNTIPTDTGGRRDIWNQRREQGERRQG